MPLFPYNLPPLPLAAQMHHWDEAAIAFGIPENMLMENAARASLSLLEELTGPVNGKIALVVMGSGNNGGDAACMARHILDKGGCPVVWHFRNIDKLQGACAWHTNLAIKAGVVFKKIDSPDNVPFFEWTENNIPDIIIDGLLGTGFSGTLKPGLEKFILAANSYVKAIKPFVLAVDIPSGLNSENGRPSPAALKASATVTLAAPKSGMLLPEARQYTGPVYVREIGMPPGVTKGVDSFMRLVDGRILLDESALPQDSYKNIYGHVTVIGGAYGMGGAAHLASASALRAGAGLVTACAPDASMHAIKGNWPEIMTLGLGNGWPDSVPDSLLNLLQKSSSLVIGPGMGRTSAGKNFLAALLSVPERPKTVFDADALVILGNNPQLLEKLTLDDIITPHPGEAGVLLGISARAVQDNRPLAVERLADISAAAAILKGAGTLIKQKNSPLLLCPYDIPQMAIGGAGDVLAGCLGALLGRRDCPSALEAAARGAMMHIIAGKICAQKYPLRGTIASGLADAIAEAEIYVRSLDRTKLNMGLLPWPL